MDMEKIRQFQKTVAENKNKEYRVFLFIFLCLFLVFFSSKLWLPSDAKIQHTAAGSERNVTASLSLTLNSWQYNPSAQYMEISYTIHGADETQDYKFIPTAHTNVNKAVALNTVVAYCSNDLLTLQIKNVPTKWQVISLWIKGKDMMAGDGISDSSTSDDTLQGANFFCDVRKVTINEHLVPQSALNYALKSIYKEITDVKTDITEINKKISMANTQINQLQFDISSLKANQKYQTDEEIQRSNSSIQNKTTQIDHLKNEIIDDQTKIKNDQEKLKKLNQKLNDTKSGKLPPSTETSSAAPTKTESDFKKATSDQDKKDMAVD